MCTIIKTLINAKKPRDAAAVLFGLTFAKIFTTSLQV